MQAAKQKMEDAFKSEEERRREEELKRKAEEKLLTKKSISFFKSNTCSIDVIRDDNLY